MGTNDMAIMRLLEHLPEANKLLSEIREEVIAAIRHDDAMNAAEQQAMALLERLQGGELMQVLADESGVELMEREGARRNGGDVPPDLRVAVFEMTPPAEEEVGQELLTLDEGYAVVALTEVRPGSLSEEEVPLRDSYRRNLANVTASSETQAFMGLLREQSVIQVFEDRLP